MLIGRYSTYEDPENNANQPSLWTLADYDKFYRENVEKATQEQRAFLEMIQEVVMQRANERMKRAYFPQINNRLHHLTGDGGVGKTWLFNVRDNPKFKITWSL